MRESMKGKAVGVGQGLSRDTAVCSNKPTSSRHRARRKQNTAGSLGKYSTAQHPKDFKGLRSIQKLQATNEEIEGGMHATLAASREPTYEEIWDRAWNAIDPPKMNANR